MGLMPTQCRNSCDYHFSSNFCHSLTAWLSRKVTVFWPCDPESIPGSDIWFSLLKEVYTNYWLQVRGGPSTVSLFLCVLITLYLIISVGWILKFLPLQIVHLHTNIFSRNVLVVPPWATTRIHNEDVSVEDFCCRWKIYRRRNFKMHTTDIFQYK